MNAANSCGCCLSILKTLSSLRAVWTLKCTQPIEMAVGILNYFTEFPK